MIFIHMCQIHVSDLLLMYEHVYVYEHPLKLDISDFYSTCWQQWLFTQNLTPCKFTHVNLRNVNVHVVNLQYGNLQFTPCNLHNVTS